MDKCEGKRRVGRPRSRVDDSIEIYLKETEWMVVDMINRALDTNKWWALVKGH
jgi:hypothetical protein